MAHGLAVPSEVWFAWRAVSILVCVVMNRTGPPRMNVGMVFYCSSLGALRNQESTIPAGTDERCGGPGRTALPLNLRSPAEPGKPKIG